MRTPPLAAIAALTLAPLAGIGLASCADADSAAKPSFDLLFPPVTGQLLSMSSPSAIDLTGDGVLDVVFGTGVERLRRDQRRYVFTDQPEISGYVVAVSGAGNEVIWRVPNPRDAFTTPRFAELNGDGVPDVIMGGREGAFGAFNGTDGTPLWRVAPAEITDTPVPYNFFTPGLIRDANGDDVVDIAVIYGGDDTKLPKEPRNPGYLVVVSGADGRVLAVHASPDSNETYSSPVVYQRPDGTEWLVFGTGGETQGGAAYRAPVASLLDGTFRARAKSLIEPGAKGVIAPATLVDLTGDDEIDIVISTFDGRLIAVAGASGEVLWDRRDQGEESYHSAAVVRLSPDGRLGLFVSRGIGTFPRYVGTVHRLLDARDGRVLYEYRDPFYPAGAPLAVDLTGDGVDEPFFFTMRYPTAQGGRIHILHLPTGELITHDLATNLSSTPLITDPRGTSTLELIALTWSVDQRPPQPDWRHLEWQLLRLDLGAATPAFRSWAGYMGTATDGRYSGTGEPRRR